MSEGDFTVALPRWKCHKIVGAAKIVAIDHGERLDLAPHGVVEVGAEWIREKHAEVGGYFVKYEDGYSSYSPAAAFESGYAKVGEEGLYVIRTLTIAQIESLVDSGIKFELLPDGRARIPVDDELLEHALHESVRLQSHYAALLNGWDGGQRFIFTPQAWVDRIAAQHSVMPPSLNPNHPVTRAMENQWHKIVAILLGRQAVNELTIPPHEVEAAMASVDGRAITIKVSDRTGIELRLVSQAEGERLAREEGGLPT